MSLVLATAMKEFIIFMSDGMVSIKKDNKVESLDENYKKLVRVNNKVCIGFAGSKEPCEEVISKLSQDDAERLSLQDIFQIIYSNAKSVYSKWRTKYIDEEIKILMMIGGISSENKIELKSFSSKENFIVNEYKPNNTDLCYLMLSPEDVNESILTNSILNNTPVSLENLQKSMEKCIEIVSESCEGVNNVKFTEVIIKEREGKK